MGDGKIEDPGKWHVFDEEVWLPGKTLFVRGKNKASWKISIVLMNIFPPEKLL